MKITLAAIRGGFVICVIIFLAICAYTFEDADPWLALKIAVVFGAIVAIEIYMALKFRKNLDS